MDDQCILGETLPIVQPNLDKTRLLLSGVAMTFLPPILAAVLLLADLYRAASFFFGFGAILMLYGIDRLHTRHCIGRYGLPSEYIRAEMTYGTHRNMNVARVVGQEQGTEERNVPERVWVTANTSGIGVSVSLALVVLFLLFSAYTLTAYIAFGFFEPIFLFYPVIYVFAFLFPYYYARRMRSEEFEGTRITVYYTRYLNLWMFFPENPKDMRRFYEDRSEMFRTNGKLLLLLGVVMVLLSSFILYHDHDSVSWMLFAVSLLFLSMGAGYLFHSRELIKRSRN